MKFEMMEQIFTVCKLGILSGDDYGELFFLSKTDNEISLICESSLVPESAIAREDGWKAIRIEGQLDFSEIGIMAKIAAPLAEHGISILAVSTYDTDYVFVREHSAAEALELLTQAF